MKHLRTALVNLIILALAAFIYAALTSPASVMALAKSSSLPVYRCAGGKEVSIQCAVTWDAAALGEIMKTLRDEGVRITFAVSCGWAENNPEMLKRMAAEGHGIAVTVAEKGGGEDAETKLERACLTVESITGMRPTLAVLTGTEDPGFVKAAEKLSLTPVICTFDLGTGGKCPERLSGGSIITVRPTRELSMALPNLIDLIKKAGLDIVPTHILLYNSMG